MTAQQENDVNTQLDAASRKEAGALAAVVTPMVPVDPKSEAAALYRQEPSDTTPLLPKGHVRPATSVV
jgi:hypothetical protein